MSLFHTYDRGVSEWQTDAGSTTFENRPFDMSTQQWNSGVVLNEQMEAIQRHQGLNIGDTFEVSSLLRSDLT
jgi:hypothetical protein